MLNIRDAPQGLHVEAHVNDDPGKDIVSPSIGDDGLWVFLENCLEHCVDDRLLTME